MTLDWEQTRLIELLNRPSSITKWPSAGSEIVIYGAGTCGREVMRVLRENGYRIAAFLDAQAEMLLSVEDVPCLLPESEKAQAYARAGIPVVLGVFNFAADSGAIQHFLERLGFACVISYYDFFEAFMDQTVSRFWLTSRSFYQKHREDLLTGLRLWSDDFSRKIYVDLIELRLTGNLQLLRDPDQKHQYFPLDLPSIPQPIRMVDGGAYVGDTLQSLLDQHLGFEAVAAFEPDPENFRQLCQFADNHRQLLGMRTLLPCGLGSQTVTCTFAMGKGGGSVIIPEGGLHIQVVALDDVLPSFNPTFIKLDIEGAEPAALCGAAGTIRRSQPKLAVCVYHKPDHLWEIPILMRELLPTHPLALRYHQFNGFDVVAYAL
ncbi:MAG TPA: FkbM family methyltransferase [Kiritimatiellia bacterium]|nr:FkbM family methyltransferase [Kiritimatiellia bacterium]HPS07015.1 FkbM family methyltransferase [Kiritimatiellia bacterium]